MRALLRIAVWGGIAWTVLGSVPALAQVNNGAPAVADALNVFLRIEGDPPRLGVGRLRIDGSAVTGSIVVTNASTGGGVEEAMDVVSVSGYVNVDADAGFGTLDLNIGVFQFINSGDNLVFVGTGFGASVVGRAFRRPGAENQARPAETLRGHYAVLLRGLQPTSPSAAAGLTLDEKGNVTGSITFGETPVLVLGAYDLNPDSVAYKIALSFSAGGAPDAVLLVSPAGGTDLFQGIGVIMLPSGRHIIDAEMRGDKLTAHDVGR